jgi:diguanylate cyclase (GGDEF)-like protein
LRRTAAALTDMTEQLEFDATHTYVDKVLSFLAWQATALTVVRGLGEMVDGTLSMLGEVADFESCVVGVIDDANDVLTMVGATGLRAASKGFAIPRGRGLHWTVVESRQVLYVPDTHADPRVLDHQDDIRSVIYVPLIVRGRVIGVLSAHRGGVDAFNARDIDVLTVLARYFAGAIEVVRLHEELRSLASTDELTRLPNRRAILERFGAELSRAQRDRQPLSVAIADVDSFKRVNDTLGHEGGDAVLVRVAQALRRGIRGHDIAGRLAGDEFILLLPNTDREEAETILRRLERIDPTGSGPAGDFAVTLSWGVATWSDDGMAIDALLAAADRRLYEMKRIHAA